MVQGSLCVRRDSPAPERNGNHKGLLRYQHRIRAHCLAISVLPAGDKDYRHARSRDSSGCSGHCGPLSGYRDKGEHYGRCGRQGGGRLLQEPHDAGVQHPQHDPRFRRREERKLHCHPSGDRPHRRLLLLHPGQRQRQRCLVSQLHGPGCRACDGPVTSYHRSSLQEQASDECAGGANGGHRRRCDGAERQCGLLVRRRPEPYAIHDQNIRLLCFRHMGRSRASGIRGAGASLPHQGHRFVRKYQRHAGVREQSGGFLGPLLDSQTAERHKHQQEHSHKGGGHR